VVAVFLFTVMDTIAKWLMRSYPVEQVVWARYCSHTALMLLLSPIYGARPLFRTSRPVGQISRGVLMVGSTLSFFAALSFIPLTDAYAISFSSPILVTLLSIPLLGEKIGLRRWTAMLVGFAGVLIVIQPGSGVASGASALALLTAFQYALYQIVTRKLSATETSLGLLFYSSVVGTVVMSAWMPFIWQTPSFLAGVVMCALGLLGAAGHLILIRALTLAPVSTTAPFGYLQLIWAIAFSFLLFGDVPDLPTVIGALLVAGSGLYIFRRTARLQAQRRATA
jgi:drug/metabolite transporter (DMT)-like permease